MFIKKVVIENFRGFKYLNAELSKLTVIIGENDTGKSNFLKAISLPLSPRSALRDVYFSN